MLHIGDKVTLNNSDSRMYTIGHICTGEEHQITVVVEIASKGLQYRLANISGSYLPDELELVMESTIKTEFKVGDIVQMTRTTQPLVPSGYIAPPITKVRLCRVDAVFDDSPLTPSGRHYNLVGIGGDRGFFGSDGSNLTLYNYTLF